jgi:ferric-dicitrate binding protein FerR (iron transport regulator)
METQEPLHTDPVALLPKVVAGEALPDEIRLVTEWIAEDPSHRKEYDDVVRIWNLTGQAVSSDDLNVDREWIKLETAVFGRRQLPWIKVLQVAAVVILVSVIALLAVRQGSVSSVTAGADRITETVLPDGSSLFLNAGSRITYKKDFGRSQRQLTLR